MRRKWFALGVVAAMAVAAAACDEAEDGDDDAGGDRDVTATTVEIPPDGLQPTEVGISATEIRIAVIADVDSSLAPGLFQGSADAVQAWAEYINDQGGLAGRQVVVDFIDSKLSPDEARNAIITACQQDFALVGTSALFVNDVTDLVGCADLEGNATGLPDIPVVTTELAHQCSPVSFPVNPPQIDCSTSEQSPQSFTQNGGQIRYYQDEFGDDLHGVFSYPNDLRAANNAGHVVGAGMQDTGVEVDQEFNISARSPQSAYTPVVQQMKDADSNYALNMGPYTQTVLLRKEATIQGVVGEDIIWDCTLQCYDQRLIDEGGTDVENQYVSVFFTPFAEADTNENAAAFIEYTGDGADGFGAQAWAGATLFQEAVEQIVERDGANGLTRAALLEEYTTFTEFDAQGMIGTTNIGERRPTSCYALLQVQAGEFVRVHPQEEGTFDCDEENVVEFEYELDLG